jgi:hypothetical protein
MPVHLSYGGVFWRLPTERTPESIQDDIKKAMEDSSPLSVTLDGGETLILNGARLGHVLVFDDKGDPNRAPTSFWNLATLIGANPASGIRVNPASVISSGIESVISSGTESVISSGMGSVISGHPASVTISWTAGPTGRGPW